ncbi:MAG: nucleotidyl transferase AbiEii/AbiGii toxin family protein [Spirochaetales bacterium]|nr:nucleotidyl transferase AbiEii/AbiGii toxin family protein [Spirochaetales bacterium]
MSIKIIQTRLDSYDCRSAIEEEHAVREITQELALAALGRTAFFKYSAFQGGTCLRIFYGLDRFSEDMDFLLKEPDSKFQLEPYLKTISDELTAYGYNIEISNRSDEDKTVKKAFLKDDSIIKVLHLSHLAGKGHIRKIKIKLEIDTNPPLKSSTEIKYLDFPYTSSVVIQDKPTLFAGKIHALLCREYLKGRDWYDFIWYTSQGIGINYKFLSSALNQQGPWKNRNMDVDRKWCHTELEKKIASIDWISAANDVHRFVRSAYHPSLELWSEDLFLSQLSKLG